MIESKDISVVVQGAIDIELTTLCLKSIRKILPNSQIILSTWQGSNINDLDYDVLIENKDPGCTVCSKQNGKNNINRQIVSTISALKAVKTKYVLKLRSDMILTNLNFIKAFIKFNRLNKFRDKEFKIFKSRVVINNLFCPDPKLTHYPYHISDWVQFGYIEDIIDLWDIPLQKEPESSQYFLLHPKPDNKYIRDDLYLQYFMEQWITISLLKKHKIDPKMEYYCDCKDENIKNTYIFLGNNFVILDYENFGIKFLKYNPSVLYGEYIKLQIKHRKWLKIYRKIILKNVMNTVTKHILSKKIKNKLRSHNDKK